MPLNVIAGSEVQTPNSGVKMDTNAFRESAAAPGRMAQAIGQDVGNLFGDLAQKIQQNRNAKQVFDADLAMRKTKDDFTAELNKMPDEGTWLPAWQERVDQIRQNVMDDPKAGPEVKRMLGQKFDVWQASTSAEIRTAALAKGVNDSRNSAIADSDYAVRQGDLKGAQDALQAAVENHAMSQEEANKRASRFPSIAAQAQADMIIASNPIKAPELIEQFKGTIEGPVFIRTQANARAARNAAQSSNLDAISQDMSTGDGTIPTEVLREKVKNGEITQRGADSLIARMKRESVNEDQNVGLRISQEITDHNFVTDKDAEASARELTERIAGVQNPGLRTRLTEKLNSKIKAAKAEGTSDQRPIIQQQLTYMRQDFMEGTAFVPMTKGIPASTKWFGLKDVPAVESKHVAGGLSGINKMTDDEFHGLFGADTKRQDVIDAAQLNYAKKQADFLAWARDPANKDATVEQATAERQRLEKPDVMAAAAQVLAPKVKGNVTQKEYEALKPGDSYFFGGKEYKKK